jgi:hypothetical protein
MLAVSRALMLRPRLLLLDEPSFGLAPKIVQHLFEIFRVINAQDGIGMLLVEQNASMALKLAQHAYLLETGRVVMSGRPRRSAATSRCGARTSAISAAMDQLIHQIPLGPRDRRHLRERRARAGDDLPGDSPRELRAGRARDVRDLPRVGADPGRRAVLGRVPDHCRERVRRRVVIERVIIRPVENAPILAVVIVFIALLVIFNSLAGWIFSYTIKPFPSPFPAQPLFGNSYVSSHELGSMAITLVVLLLLFVFFRYTPLGLAMRAAAQNPESSRLVGIRVGWMLALGWGLAAAIGAIAGMMVAPTVFLEPNMMGGILLYAFAGALLGGIDSPGGAVLGGFIVGVLENVVGAYVGTELKLTVALIVIVGRAGRAAVRAVRQGPRDAGLTMETTAAPLTMPAAPRASTGRAGAAT